MLIGVDLQELDSVGSTGVGFYWICRRWILLDLQEVDFIGSTGGSTGVGLLDLQELEILDPQELVI